MNRAIVKFVPAGVVAVVLMPFATSLAHHSRAHFLLDETIELEGTITEVNWRSSHVYFEVEALDAAGVVQTWTREGDTITIEDPVHLSERVTEEGEYRKSSDYAFVSETCDVETARRHLEFF